MTHVLTIARRDLAERASIFVAAAVLAVLPFVITLVPGMPQFPSTDVITTAGGLISVGFTLGLALVLGVTMIGRDLTEKRMSFYFSKPLSAQAIWFGKLGAALVSLALCFTVIFVPSYLAGTTSWHKSWNVELPVAFAIIATAALVMLLFGHFFGTMFRSKSPLVALDVVLIVAAGFALVGIIRPLLTGFAVDLTTRVAFILGGAMLLILLSGGAWQLAKGRADRRQNHIELSRFVWISMAIVLAIGGAFTAWVVHVTPGDLQSLEVSQPDQGTWSFLSGKAKHRMDYNALFAYDLATGEHLRIDGVRSWFSSGFSHDGKMLAYVKLPGQLYLLPLSPGAKPQDLQVTLGRGAQYVFSDDGTRIAVVDSDGIVTAYEIASKRALVSAKMPNTLRTARRLFFASPDVVRLYVESPQYGSIKASDYLVEIYELDVRTRALAHTGSYRTVTKDFGMTVSPDGARALVVERDEKSVSRAFIIDARTAQVIAPVPSADLMHTVLFADSSVGILTKDAAEQWTLTVHPLDGAERRIPIAKIARLYFARELKGGTVVLAGWKDKKSTMFVVDYAHGSVLRSEPDLRSPGFGYQQWYDADPRRVVTDADQPFAAWGDAKSLYAWQPLTGAKRKMLEF